MKGRYGLATAIGGSLLLLASLAGPHAAAGDERADLSRYEKVMIEPVTVSFDEKWKPVKTGSRVDAQEAEKERSRERIATLFNEAVRKELARSGTVEVVEEPGPGVLRIQPQLSDVFLHASLEPTAQALDTYVRNIGNFTVSAVFRNSETGEVLLILEDHMRGRELNLTRSATPAYNEYELQRMFRNWATEVRRDIFQAS